MEKELKHTKAASIFANLFIARTKHIYKNKAEMEKGMRNFLNYVKC